tara:strand:- start:243 stop:407 length:165 start_codon:yes stop_codon:yes gene_type:complete
VKFLIIDLILLTVKSSPSGETIYGAEGATTPETLRQKDRLKHNTLEREWFPPKE